MESLPTAGDSYRSNTHTSETVLAAIERADGTDALEFDPVFASVIDPDALDRLVAADSFDGTVTFSYMGYEVLVRSDGTVSVSPSA